MFCLLFANNYNRWKKIWVNFKCLFFYIDGSQTKVLKYPFKKRYWYKPFVTSAMPSQSQTIHGHPSCTAYKCISNKKAVLLISACAHCLRSHSGYVTIWHISHKISGFVHNVLGRCHKPEPYVDYSGAWCTPFTELTKLVQSEMFALHISCLCRSLKIKITILNLKYTYQFWNFNTNK